jgi:competence protein ComEC
MGSDAPRLDLERDAEAGADEALGRPRYPGAAPAGAAARIAGMVRASALRAGAAYIREIEYGRGFVWIPVFFGVGILVYFGLPREPSLLAVSLLAAAAVAAAVKARSTALRLQLLIALAAVMCGLAAAKLRTDLSAANVLARERSVTVTGWVEEKTRLGADGARFTVRVQSISGVAKDALPHSIRFSTRADAREIAYGDGVTATARLGPPTGPVLPGGHDFARTDYYRQVGGTGFSFGAPKPADLEPAPFDIRVFQPLETLRQGIAKRIEAALPGEAGGIAVALTIGDQGGISEATKDHLRLSGLAHILSISGLHMVLVAGTAFWALRALFALFPSLALRFPIKKWSALGALGVASVYLGISGAEIPTQRAYVILVIALAAILFDRRAISLRNVATAALAVLVFAPESLLSASFQMSFAASIALVSGYEAVAAHYRARLAKPEAREFGIWRKAKLWVGGAALTALLAGTATAPFAAFHFQRVAPLSLIANLAAEPFVALIVMPMGLLGVLAMPFGLETYPLWMMEQGLAAVTWISATVASWSSEAGTVRAFSPFALLMLSAGFLWLALWRERWRLLGIVLMVLAVPIAMATPQPDIVIDSTGAAMAVRGADGTYRILGGKGASYAIETWLRADGDSRDPKDKSLRDGVACDSLGCTAEIGATGMRAALALDPRALVEDCGAAAVIAGAFDAQAGCPAARAIIDRDSLAQGGSVSLYLRAGEAGPEFRVRTAYPPVRRAWMPPAPTSSWPDQ